MDDPAEQMRNLGICSGGVLIVVIAILGICYYKLNADKNRSGDVQEGGISTISSNSSQVSLPTYYQPPPAYDEVIRVIFEERRKSMEEYLVENEELPPSYEEFCEKQSPIKK